MMRSTTSKLLSAAYLAVLMLVLGAGLVRPAAAAAPLAGTNIGNQASATYTDASAISRTATSNTVTTVVQQVGAFTLTASQSKIVAPGGTVYFPHTVTNTGNGTDTFNLTAVDANTGNINFTGIVMYVDADGNGVPDNATPITSSGPIAAGGVFRFVVAASIGAQNNNDTDTITVTADNTFDGYANQVNTDTVTVSANAVINVTKSLSSASGNPGAGPVTVTLTYTNTGNSTATNVALRDAIPSGMNYVAGSGRWSVSGATALTDANGGDPAGINYDAVTTANTVFAVISSVAPGVSGTLTFQVNIANPQAAGPINNTGRFCYNNGAADTPAGCTPTDSTSVGNNGTSTNTATFTVNQVASVVIRDTGVSDAALAQSDSDLTLNDVALVASATQGATVSFKSVIVNNGNFADSFSLAVSGSTFPAGTTFQIFQSDGVTPLVGATPAVAASGTYAIFVKATLPIAASGGGAYDVTVTATSVFNTGVSDTTTDRLTTITASTVDLRNTSAAGPGGGAGPEGAPVTTNTVVPGATTTFTLYVNNTSNVADSYDLAASQTTTFPGTLPAGWSVTFKADGGAGDCSSTGAVITNTGTINLGASKAVCAQVTVPAGAAAIPSPGQSIYFRALSPSTGAADVKHDAVIVQTVRAVAVTPNNSGQVFPGGSVVYAHILTNNGNVLEGNGTASTITLATALAGVTAGWTNTIYWDKNNDGVLDAGDPVVPATGIHNTDGGAGSLADGLAPGETQRIFVKVFAPAGAAIGDVNTTTLTATTTGVINTIAAPAASSATDTTTVIGGQVTLNKLQALDAACDGTADTAFGSANITTGAIPGACVRYQITATNVGTSAVTSLVVSDATPANTVYNDGSGPTCGGAVTAAAAITPSAGNSITAPTCGSAGTIQATIPTLNAGSSVVITFGIRINP